MNDNINQSNYSFQIGEALTIPQTDALGRSEIKQSQNLNEGSQEDGME